MAKESVIVPVHVLVEKALPPVCAVSGKPTEHMSVFRFSDSSLVRALTAAFVRAEHRRKFVTGSVPLSADRVRWRQRLRIVALGTGIGGLIAGVVGIATQAVVPITIMLVLANFSILSVAVRARVSPQGVLQGQYVWLTRVDPVFAEAAVDLVRGVRRPADDETVMRAGIGPVPSRAVLGLGLWLFVIVWIAIR